jgi:ABC transporter with metal-binding/Fe-S-binding domain ATP-binding protein
MHPRSDESLLFHYPNSRVTKYLAESMGLPLVESSVDTNSKEAEVGALDRAISNARSRYDFDGVVYGGIASGFQKRIFDDVCRRHHLATVSPLWHSEPVSYMRELLDRGFRIMIVSTSAMGLGKHLLGSILDAPSLEQLAYLSKKYGFNLNFEGGEAETLVVDCPLYSKRLEVKKSEIHWDGQRGIFEIREAALVEK